MCASTNWQKTWHKFNGLADRGMRLWPESVRCVRGGIGLYTDTGFCGKTQKPLRPDSWFCG